MITARLQIDPQGTVRCLYTEAIDLRSLGPLEVVRAAEVRFDPDSQQWEVRSPDSDAVLYRSTSRNTCLAWEQANLQPGGAGSH